MKRNKLQRKILHTVMMAYRTMRRQTNSWSVKSWTG